MAEFDYDKLAASMRQRAKPFREASMLGEAKELEEIARALVQAGREHKALQKIARADDTTTFPAPPAYVLAKWAREALS